MENKIALRLQNLSFGYSKDQNIIQDFNLEVEEGSFTTLLGESGSGKTTILRLIAGFLEPSKGKILLDGNEMNGISPDLRSIGMVFQDYALFPHMTVQENISYGLKVSHKNTKKLKKDEIIKLVSEVSEALGITSLLKRFPHELSGGQQQRVALARALILKPKVLLMDEPLSSLDAKLREKVRDELKEIQMKLGITTVYVTHDQSEALSLSDKIAVLHQGKLLQYDSPRQLYFKPGDKYTADFIGRANFIEIEGEIYLVRPEWFKLSGIKESEKFPIINGIILSTAFLGEKTRFIVKSEDQKVYVADLPTLETLAFSEGRLIQLCVNHYWKIK